MNRLDHTCPSCERDLSYPGQPGHTDAPASEWERQRGEARKHLLWAVHHAHLFYPEPEDYSARVGWLVDAVVGIHREWEGPQ